MSATSRPMLRRTSLVGAALLLLCVAYVAVVLACFRLRYTTNDGTGIVSFITEGDTVPYVGVLLSGALHAAYVACPRVAWFGVALYAFLTLTLVTWVALIGSVFRDRLIAAALMVAVFGCYLGLLTSLDFTATAAMLCFTGLCWACLQMLEDAAPVPWRLVCAGLLFMAGMWVRPDAAPGTLAYAAPLGVMVCAGRLRERPLTVTLRRLGVAAILFFTPALLNLAVDSLGRRSARTPVEASYVAFNRAGGRLYHLSRERRVLLGREHALIASLGWRQADYTYLTDWKFLDERLYTPERIDRLVAHAPLPELSAEDLETLALDRLPPRNRVFLLLLAGAPLYLLSLRRRPGEGVPGLLLPLYAFGLTACMCLLYAFPGRVEMPFEMGLGCCGLIVAGASSRRAGLGERVLQAGAWVVVLVALIVAAASVREVVKSQRTDALLAARTTQTVRTLNTRFAGDVFLIQPTVLALHALSPLAPLELRFQQINLGWNTFSPRFYRQIQLTGAQHGYELIDAMVDNPRAYLLGSALWARKMLVYATVHPPERIQVVQVAPDVQQLRMVPPD